MAEQLSAVFYSAREAEFDFRKSANCQFATFTAVSPAKLRPNEDCAGWIRLNQNHWIFMVADGLGGLPAGDAASTTAVSTIIERLRGFDQIDITSPLLMAIEQANQEILDGGKGGATTLAMIEMHQDTVRPIHIGDSTLMITGQRGAVKFNSVSHSPTGYLEEAGLLTEMEAMMHHERHLVSNVIGSEAMRIEVGPRIKLGRYDTIVIASDGLCDNLYQHQIVEAIRKGPLDKGLDDLVAQCRTTMSSGSDSSPSHPDDLTILALRRNR